jgi:hypothetical protein
MECAAFCEASIIGVVKVRGGRSKIFELRISFEEESPLRMDCASNTVARETSEVAPQACRKKAPFALPRDFSRSPHRLSVRQIVAGD